LKLTVIKSIVKRTKFSNTIIKIAKAILVAKVELEFEQESEQGEPLLLSQLEPEVIIV
jgi:hypothetical protein